MNRTFNYFTNLNIQTALLDYFTYTSILYRNNVKSNYSMLEV